MSHAAIGWASHKLLLPQCWCGVHEASLSPRLTATAWTQRNGDCVAVWVLGDSTAEPGHLAFAMVLGMFQRAPKKGYTMLERVDPTAPPDASYLKLKLLVTSDTCAHILVPKPSGVRFIRLPASDVVQRLAWTPAHVPTSGSIRIHAADVARLDGRSEALRAAAVSAIEERDAAEAARVVARTQRR